jgi:hypothetical protein
VLEQRLQITREGVVVEAGGRLARPPEAATVVADAAVTGREQLPLLALPGVAVERIAVDQDDRPAAAVIVVVDLDVAAVLTTDLHERHADLLLACPDRQTEARSHRRRPVAPVHSLVTGRAALN